MGGPKMANTALRMMQNKYRGNVGGGIIQTFIGLLPENSIRLPNSVFVNYEMADDNRARIDNGRMIGYFKGEVMGIPAD